MTKPRDTEILSGDQILAEGLEGWVTLHETLQARFDTPDYGTGAAFVAQVADAAEAADHHPDVDLRYGFVHITLMSHDVAGKTRRDVELARRIGDIAQSLGLRPRPETLASLDLALDTADPDEIAPFWRAVLGHRPHPRFEGDLRSPDGTLPSMWFQRTDAHAEPRQRFHLDLWVAPDTVADRIEAALAAGGTLVDDAQAPKFWVLADPQGNKVCLCTHRTRSD